MAADPNKALVRAALADGTVYWRRGQVAARTEWTRGPEATHTPLTSDVSHAVERCREVCRLKGTFLVDVNDWDCESRDNLRACGSDGTIVVCSSGGVAKELTSNESRLLDFLAAGCNSNCKLERKSIAKCVRHHKCGILGGGWALRRVRPSSGLLCQDGGERLHKQDGSP